MTRRILPRLAVSAATLAVLAVAFTALAGSSFAEGSAAQANYAPTNTAPPVISGTAQLGQTLTTTTGTWTYQTAPSYSFQWQRCNSSGASCSTIAGAAASTYVVQSADSGSTLRAVVTAQNADGTTSATSAQTAAVGSNAPSNSVLPAITGTPKVGQTLTTSTGTWNSPTTPTYAYAWQRCNSTGDACVAIAGATASTYVAQTADSGSTLRAQVTAANAQGTASATSAQTAAVVAASGTSGSVPASSVTLPLRLVIDQVSFQPRRLTNRASILARFHVSDTLGNSVNGALVYTIGLPYSWAKSGAEVASGTDGWATLSIQPTRNLPLGRGHALVFFVRARVAGQPILAGSSTRRLVQVLTG
ncbi:MAG: hypothetical protein ABSB24_15065 [Gaiellaceae bacterium]|jgi:hypothetical protein